MLIVGLITFFISVFEDQFSHVVIHLHFLIKLWSLMFLNSFYVENFIVDYYNIVKVNEVVIFLKQHLFIFFNFCIVRKISRNERRKW